MKKTHAFTRKALYDLVWTEPRTRLAKRIGLSDVAIAKACRKAGIPMPSPGHWAKKAAGKRTAIPPLPLREPGVDDVIRLGGSRYDYGHYRTDEEVRQMVTEPPQFEESIDQLRERVKARLGKIAQPRSLRNPHVAIARLIEQDNDRREKVRLGGFVSPWDAPKFDSPTEKRRLKILSGIFLAAAKSGARGVVDNEGRESSVTVGDQHVRVGIEVVEIKNSRKVQGRKKADRFRLTVGHSWDRSGPAPMVWQDTEERDIESLVPEIVLEVILMGERQYRDHKHYQYKSLVERKAKLEEAERQRIEAQARMERERIERLRQARVQRLLDESAAYRQACDIRGYVNQVLASVPFESAADREKAEAWAEWARGQADFLDPIISGRFDMSDPAID